MSNNSFRPKTPNNDSQYSIKHSVTEVINFFIFFQNLSSEVEQITLNNSLFSHLIKSKIFENF
jgi:hypothetical protein